MSLGTFRQIDLRVRIIEAGKLLEKLCLDKAVRSIVAVDEIVVQMNQHPRKVHLGLCKNPN